MLRNQTAAGAKALAGQDGSTQTGAAQYAANQAATGASGGGMRDFASPGSPPSPNNPSPPSPNSPPAPSPDAPFGKGLLDGDIEPTEPGGEKEMPANTGSKYAGVKAVIVVKDEKEKIVNKTVEIVNGEIIIDGKQVMAQDVNTGKPVNAKVDSGLIVDTDKYEKPLLDPFVLALIAYSPTLQKNLEALIKSGWDVKYTDKKYSHVDREKETIFIKEGQNEIGVLQSLAHEVGHALTPVTFEGSLNEIVQNLNKKGELKEVLNDPQKYEALLGDLKKVYMDDKYENEGAAFLKGIEIQQEILAKGGPNIGLNCDPGAPKPGGGGLT
ncbi:MAG: hypothetical protein FWD51_04940 [Betaproteobacteria bacterium]|nr:hypothetical protein [Betaproteobacteria bacterium]